MLDAILNGLLGDALWDLGVGPLAHVAVDRVTRRTLRGRDATGKYARVVANATARAPAELTDALPPREELENVLQRPEVRDLVRELYVFRLDEMTRSGLAGTKTAQRRTSRRSNEHVRAAFRAYWRQQTGASDDVADALFAVVVRAANDVVQTAIQEGDLAAYEAASEARARILGDHVSALERKLESFSLPRIDVDQILAFEAPYREEAAERLAKITPPSFSAAPRVPINDLYVPPWLLVSERDSPGARKRALQHWLSGIDRAVVLGDPGAGKSTLSRKILADAATLHRERPVANRPLTPFLVVLRDYAQEKKRTPLSIVDFITSDLRTSFQLAPPQRSVEYLLLNGRALVVFDGLDELLDASQRQAIRDELESFARRYPSAPIIVTSREVGYDAAPLSDDFVVARITDFDDSQVADYARKWFGLDPSLTNRERSENAQAFVTESEIAPDLRRNPLMLALMCGLYRGQGYIPRNAPDVYSDCAKMLFEVWDTSRGIRSLLPIADHIPFAMRHLAHWIYSTPQLQGGVTTQELEDETTRFLQEWRFDDPFEARRAAEAFVEFCRGRAWVFSDLGLARDGQDLFQFTHRTFLEYFTADYLAAKHSDPRALARALIPHISRLEWDVVAQLAFRIKSRGLFGGADDLLRAVLIAAEKSKSLESRINLLAFAARALAFLVPTPAVTSEVARTTIELALELATPSNDDTPLAPVGTHPSRLLRPLLAVNDETAPAVARAAIETLVNRAISADQEGTGVAAVILLQVSGMVFALYEPRGPARDAWIKSARDAITGIKSRLQALAVQEPDVATALLYAERENSEFSRVGPLFRPMPYWFRADAGLASPAHTLLADALSRPSAGLHPAQLARQRPTVAALMRFGERALSFALPWVAYEDVRTALNRFPWLADDLPPAATEDLDSSARFGALCLVGVYIEALTIKGLSETAEGSFYAADAVAAMQSRGGIWALLAAFCQGRLQDADTVTPEILDALLAKRQQKWVATRWVRGEVHLVSTDRAAATTIE